MRNLRHKRVTPLVSVTKKLPCLLWEASQAFWLCCHSRPHLTLYASFLALNALISLPPPPLPHQRSPSPLGPELPKARVSSSSPLSSYAQSVFNTYSLDGAKQYRSIHLLSDSLRATSVLKFRMFLDFRKFSAHTIPYDHWGDLGQQPTVKFMNVSTAKHMSGHTKWVNRDHK